LLELASCAEICFLSLILRHTRRPEHISVSLRILQAVRTELESRGQDASLNSATVADALELCRRFEVETQDAADAVGVEAYLAHALTTDEPLHLEGPPTGSLPRLSVLDKRCTTNMTQMDSHSHPGFLAGLADNASFCQFQKHALVTELCNSLEQLGLLSDSCGIVLSLSGGVDSMVTCCLLRLLHAQLPPSKRFKLCAIHLCHPNRSDAIDEEGWVRWSCSQLGVQLFTYRLKIRRPHGDLRTGISRERYEEKSKELRFRMYSRCLSHLQTQRGVAFVAHHQDDADENRLAELGKGNILHIDGMSRSSEMLGVEVVRPLLGVRKDELIEFASAAGVCYMQDSTPKWSRRGWIRRTLDGIGRDSASQHAGLLEDLTQAGATSEALGNTLDASLRAWKGRGIVQLTLDVPRALETSSAAKKKNKGNKSGKNTSHQSNGQQTVDAECHVEQVDGGQVAVDKVPVVILFLGELLQLSGTFETQVIQLQKAIAAVASTWNQAIGAQQERVPNGTKADDDERSDADGSEADDAPGPCPLQPIGIHGASIEVGPFLLSRAVNAASATCEQVRHFLHGLPVARRSLSHLWDSIHHARREYQWGALHKKCPCLYLRDTSCLILFDEESDTVNFADKAWQRSFATAALAYAQGQKTSPPGETMVASQHGIGGS